MPYLVLGLTQGCVSGNYGNHRYWGVAKTYSVWTMGIREFRMYSCQGIEADNVAQWSIIGSNVANILDGDTGTEATLSYQNGRIVYDFQVPVEVNRLEYVEGSNQSAAELQVIYSDDGINFTIAFTLQDPSQFIWVKCDIGVDTSWIPFTP